MTAAIELREASRAFGSVVALDRVSLEIAPGEFFALLGPSGSGKTTCLRLVAGFDQPDSGQVLLEGVDVTAVPPFDRDVNTVFQDYALFPHMSVAENVAYGLRVRGVATAERRRRALEMLELVRLGDFAERRPNQLSGGQKQRVALASVLALQPEVLVLDEPTSQLDPQAAEEVLIALRHLNEDLGLTVILSEHRLERVVQYADRVLAQECFVKLQPFEAVMLRTRIPDQRTGLAAAGAPLSAETMGTDAPRRGVMRLP